MRVRKLLDWRKLLIYKAERLDRANRSGYYGLDGLDFALLYRYRLLWDVVAIALLAGVGVSSVTSIMPALRRLARHARSLAPAALTASSAPQRGSSTAVRVDP
jgi:hypothetical protein